MYNLSHKFKRTLIKLQRYNGTGRTVFTAGINYAIRDHYEAPQFTKAKVMHVLKKALNLQLKIYALLPHLPINKRHSFYISFQVLINLSILRDPELTSPSLRNTGRNAGLEILTSSRQQVPRGLNPNISFMKK